MIKTVGGILAASALLLIAAAAGTAGILTTAAPASATALPSRHALDDIPTKPTELLPLYQRAAQECPGLSWTVLAAIGKVETDHGRHPTMISTAGALGPMQFLPATFALYDQPIPPGGQDPPSPWHPVNAIYAASRLLCAHGARDNQDIEQAIWHYNHADWYVDKALAQAARYTALPQPHSTQHAPNPKAATALTYARKHIGLPYVWGGNGPQHGHTGFDCSGLTQTAYAAAGIHLPRTAQDQYHATTHLAPNTPLLPGDLVFYGTPDNVHHVGLYTGNNHMINAPRPHEHIREEPYRYPGDDYLGATRPWH